MKREAISVCIATYNGEKYIYEQINSILAQLTEDDEIIISDDNSTDATLQIINDFQDARIKVASCGCHLGCSLNFENAIRHANNDIIFLSDQDDVWVENKVDLMLEMLSSCNLVVSNAYITDGFLNIKYHSLFDKIGVKNGFLTNFIKSRYCGSCMAFDYKVKKAVLPFPKKSKYCQHDYWIAIVSEAMFKVKLLDNQLIYYRRHDANLSSGGFSENNTRKMSLKIKTRIYCFCHLILRSICMSIKVRDRDEQSK